MGTRIVVMNSHLFYLRYFDEIYVVNKDEESNQSTIAIKTTYDELVKNEQFSHLIPSQIEHEYVEEDSDDYHDEEEVKDSEEYEGLPHTVPFDVSRLSDKTIEKQREFETGPVPLNVYFDFFWSAIHGDFDFKSTW